jgi:peptidoglycan-associated lipoprotein
MKQTLWGLAVLCLLVGVNGCAKKPLVKPSEPPPPPVAVQKAPEAKTEEPAEAPAPAPPEERFVFRTVHFDYDSHTIRDDDKPVLGEVAKAMRKNTVARLALEGHCDERGTIEYNLALGERRAQAVRDYIIGYGVDKERFTVTSYGKERPVALGHDEASWAQNRRVEGKLE